AALCLTRSTGRTEQPCRPRAVLHDGLPEQTFLSAIEQPQVMSSTRHSALLQPLLGQPGAPRQQLRRAPYQLPLTAGMSGMTEPERVREPSARGDDGDALFQQRVQLQ